MTPSLEDPAVLEAKRRRAARGTRAVSDYEDASQNYTLRKARSFWLLMGLVPGLAAVPLVVASTNLLGRPGTSLSVAVVIYGGTAWVIFCTGKITLTWHRRLLRWRVLAGMGVWAVLMVANFVSIYLLMIAFWCIGMFLA